MLEVIQNGKMSTITVDHISDSMYIGAVHGNGNKIYIKKIFLSSENISGFAFLSSGNEDDDDFLCTTPSIYSTKQGAINDKLSDPNEYKFYATHSRKEFYRWLAE